MGKFDKYFDLVADLVRKHPKGKAYDKEGRFYPDPTPVAPPVGNSLVADIDMFDVMRRRLLAETSIRAQQEGFESEEEANDFNTGEFEDEPFSPYEEIMEQAQMDGPVSRPTYHELNRAVQSEIDADIKLAEREARKPKPKEASASEQPSNAPKENPGSPSKAPGGSSGGVQGGA